MASAFAVDRKHHVGSVGQEQKWSFLGVELFRINLMSMLSCASHQHWNLAAGNDMAFSFSQTNRPLMILIVSSAITDTHS